MKKITAFLLSLALILTFATAVQAEAKPVSVWINDKQVELSGHDPIITSNTTLVLAKPLLEQFGFTVAWDPGQKIVTGTKTDFAVSFQIGKQTALINGKEEALPAAPQIVKGTAYVPVRFISEAVGYTVEWNNATKVITLKAKEAARGFLWKTEANGNTVYLLGSIHIANDAMYPLRSEIQDAFDASSFLVVEADISQAATPEIQQKVVDLSTYKDKTTLKDQVSAETYDKVVEILKENGAPVDAFDAYKTWSVSSSIDYLTALKNDFSTGVGIDAYFLNQANEKKLPILELESFEFQLNMFESFSKELQESMLKDSITSYHMTEKPLDYLSDMWVSGDDEQLLEMTKAMAGNEEMYNTVLKNRNIGMVDKINGYLTGKENKTYMVIIGAAHMLGDDGVITLLEKKGFQVARQ